MPRDRQCLIIFLHGVGSRGADLALLADMWRDALPNAIFAAPNAPHPSSFGSGYQWFSVLGVTDENRPERLVNARISFDAVVGAIVAENGYSDKLDRVAVVGFSQGTIMALDAVASGRWSFGAVVGFSGRLATPEPLATSMATKVLLIHGGADAVIAAAEMTHAASILQPIFLSVEKLLLPGVQHTITNEGADRAVGFLSETVHAES